MNMIDALNVVPFTRWTLLALKMLITIKPDNSNEQGDIL